MKAKCENCELDFQREPGFYLGTIYVNYGLTSLISAIAYPALTFSGFAERRTALFVVLAFVVIFPLWFFRYARALWLGLDEYMDPSTPSASD